MTIWSWDTWAVAEVDKIRSLSLIKSCEKCQEYQDWRLEFKFVRLLIFFRLKFFRSLQNVKKIEGLNEFGKKSLLAEIETN